MLLRVASVLNKSLALILLLFLAPVSSCFFALGAGDQLLEAERVWFEDGNAGLALQSLSDYVHMRPLEESNYRRARNLAIAIARQTRDASNLEATLKILESISRPGRRLSRQRAYILLKLKKLRLAEEVLWSSAISEDNGFFLYLAYLDLAKEEIAARHFQEALITCNKAASLRPASSTGSSRYCGMAFEGLGEYQKARAAYSNVLKLDPADQEIRSRQIRLLSKIGDLKGYQKESEIFATVERTKTRLQLVLNRMRDVVELADNKVVLLKLKDSPYLSTKKKIEIARCFKILNEVEIARTILLSLASENPKQLDVYGQLALLEAHSRNRDAALKWYEETMKCFDEPKSGPGFQSKIADYARYLISLNRWSEALSVVQSGRYDQTSDSSIRCRTLLLEARCLLTLKQNQAALKTLSKVTSLQPYSVEAYELRAQVLKALGRLQESLADLNRAKTIRQQEVLNKLGEPL